MLDFYELKETVLDFTRKKPMLAFITVIILLFFMLAMIVLFIQSSKPKQETYEKPNIVLDATPLSPDGPELEKDYYPSRTTQSNWNNEEIKQWFTVPDKEMTEELERANDNIIKEITGAAP